MRRLGQEGGTRPMERETEKGVREIPRLGPEPGEDGTATTWWGRRPRRALGGHSIWFGGPVQHLGPSHTVMQVTVGDWTGGCI